MTGPTSEAIGFNPHYEQSNEQRLKLIEDMEWFHDNSSEVHPRMFDRYTQELARRATELAARPEVYPLQVYGFATQLAALNPELAPLAEAMVITKFADEAKQSKEPKIVDALSQEAIDIIDKTREYATETDDDTITLPRIAITASMDYMQEQISEHPGSKMQEIADSHEQTPQQILAEPAPESHPEAEIVEFATGYMPAAKPGKAGLSKLLRRVVGA